MSARYGLRQEDAPLLPPRPLTLPKRAAWFLDELVKAGAAGVTTVAYPGVRVGDCILKLRKAGVVIQTRYEVHGGEFAGKHGRYVLESRVELLADDPSNLTQDPSSLSAPVSVGMMVAP